MKLYKTRILVMNLQNLEEDTVALPLGREYVLLERYDMAREILWALQGLSQNLIPQAVTSRGGSCFPPSYKRCHQDTALPERIHSTGQTRCFSAKTSVEHVVLLGSISQNYKAQCIIGQSRSFRY